jgi:hypothetical protein
MDDLDKAIDEAAKRISLKMDYYLDNRAKELGITRSAFDAMIAKELNEKANGPKCPFCDPT